MKLNSSQIKYIRDLNDCGYSPTVVAKIATYAFNSELVTEDMVLSVTI